MCALKTFICAFSMSKASSFDWFVFWFNTVSFFSLPILDDIISVLFFLPFWFETDRAIRIILRSQIRSHKVVWSRCTLTLPAANAIALWYYEFLIGLQIVHKLPSWKRRYWIFEPSIFKLSVQMIVQTLERLMRSKPDAYMIYEYFVEWKSLLNIIWDFFISPIKTSGNGLFARGRKSIAGYRPKRNNTSIGIIYVIKKSRSVWWIARSLPFDRGKKGTETEVEELGEGGRWGGKMDVGWGTRCTYVERNRTQNLTDAQNRRWNDRHPKCNAYQFKSTDDVSDNSGAHTFPATWQTIHGMLHSYRFNNISLENFAEIVLVNNLVHSRRP